MSFAIAFFFAVALVVSASLAVLLLWQRNQKNLQAVASEVETTEASVSQVCSPPIMLIDAESACKCLSIELDIPGCFFAIVRK